MTSILAVISLILKPFISLGKMINWLWKRFSAHSLEEHKSKLKVQAQISIDTYSLRKMARNRIREGLSEIEKKSQEARSAFVSTLIDSHDEYECLKFSNAREKKEEAFRSVESFRKMVLDIQGDLGDASDNIAGACETASEHLKIYIAFASEKGISSEDLEEHRTAGDAVRKILAAEDKIDAACLQQT